MAGMLKVSPREEDISWTFSAEEIANHFGRTGFRSAKRRCHTLVIFPSSVKYDGLTSFYLESRLKRGQLETMRKRGTESWHCGERQARTGGSPTRSAMRAKKRTASTLSARTHSRARLLSPTPSFASLHFEGFIPCEPPLGCSFYLYYLIKPVAEILISWSTWPVCPDTNVLWVINIQTTHCRSHDCLWTDRHLPLFNSTYSWEMSLPSPLIWPIKTFIWVTFYAPGEPKLNKVATAAFEWLILMFFKSLVPLQFRSGRGLFGSSWCHITLRGQSEFSIKLCCKIPWVKPT